MSVSEDPVILIGIDLSCSPAETGIAVAVHARSGTELVGIRRGSDATLPKGATRAQQTAKAITKARELARHPEAKVLYAIDVPMGWPREFVAKLSEGVQVQAGTPWLFGPDPKGLNERLRKRRTDMAVGKLQRVDPYSVSMDKLGATAVFARQLLAELLPAQESRLLLPGCGRSVDELADESVIEVYPGATFVAWSERVIDPPGWAKGRGLKQCWDVHHEGTNNNAAAGRIRDCIRHFQFARPAECELGVEAFPAVRRTSAGDKWSRKMTEHEWDALWCVIAARDFLTADSFIGMDEADAEDDWRIEGFIWVRDHPAKHRIENDD